MIYIINVNVNRYFKVTVDAESLDDAQSTVSSLYADVSLDAISGVEVEEVTSTDIWLLTND